MTYQRPLLKTLLLRISELRKFIQVIAGPRQVGKTTIALALRDNADELAEYHSADDTVSYGSAWLDQIWEALRIRMRMNNLDSAILIFDEIQKISDWSAVVKKNWDRDTREKRSIKLVLLGSSRLLIMDGLSESLAGRFELTYAGHWSFTEMSTAFGFSVEQYQWFGGYPGAAELVNDELRFKEYIRNAIIEPTIIRDVLMTAKIDKPALFRQLIEVGIMYSTQIVSFTKMLGQLQDVGNTTTLSRYLKLLDQAGLLSGLNKYSGSIIVTKGTIPKLQVHNSALFSSMSDSLFEETIINRKEWGSVVENSVGAHLINQVNKITNASLFYWRDNGMEIDYVIVQGKKIVGIEVKCGDEGISGKSMERFIGCFPNAKVILVGKNGIPYDVFMKAELSDII